MDRFTFKSGRLLALIAAVVLVGAITTTVRAEEEGMDTSGSVLDNFSFSTGFDITTDYYFRGILQENQGFIFQPHFELGYTVFDEGDGFFKSLDLYAGSWNSIHSDDATATGSPHSWYEADYYLGFKVGLPGNFSVDLSYIWLDAPSGAFGVDEFAEEIDLEIAYDDSSHWASVDIPGFEGLAPYFLIAYETQGASDGFASRNKGDMYFELGIEPSFTLIQSESYPITLSVPMTLGLGSEYYEVDTNGDGISDDDDSFGYFDVGLVFSMPLAFMDTSIGGEWEMSVGAHFLFLGDNAEFIAGDENFEVIGTFGIGVSF